MEDIRFNSIKEVNNCFDKLVVLGGGAEGICYKNKKLVYNSKKIIEAMPRLFFCYYNFG